MYILQFNRPIPGVRKYVISELERDDEDVMFVAARIYEDYDSGLMHYELLDAEDLVRAQGDDPDFMGDQVQVNTEVTPYMETSNEILVFQVILELVRTSLNNPEFRVHTEAAPPTSYIG